VKVSPQRLRAHLDKYKVNYTLVPGWNTARIDPYKGRSDFVGVLLHHTAGTNSLNYIVNTNPYAPVRACHFLVQRDGTVQVVSGVGAYHAGAGGPYRFTRNVTVPKDSGNSRLYGIEIESLGTSAKIDGKPQGMTEAQVVSTAMLCVALLDAMSVGPIPLRVPRVIGHKTWTRRKIDPRQDIAWWQQAVRIARKHRGKPVQARRLVREFVQAHPNGRLEYL
jgi:N-acetyl-anhydromuramyl-L-alanine amidase AmpD